MSLVKTLYPVLRSALFQLPAETSHDVALKMLRLLEKTGGIGLLSVAPLEKPVSCMGLTFPNPVGLAAGLDKNGDYIDALGRLGFGFLELGTVTPKPQPGNPQPRLFRLAEERAIINRMGFNNKGVDHLVNQVRASQFRARGGIVGINIGKNFSTPVEEAVNDYLICLDRVYDIADYIVINISSPNTPGLRNLQFGESLANLLGPIKSRQQELESQSQRYVPLVVKIAPDMSQEETQLVAEQLMKHEIDGVTATNTTSGRVGVENSPYQEEAGGLSGAPLTELSTQTLATLVACVDKKMSVIGVGGIMEGAHAEQKWRAGAQLVQLYTGFIYQGSELIKACVDAYPNLASS